MEAFAVHQSRGEERERARAPDVLGREVTLPANGGRMVGACIFD